MFDVFRINAKGESRQIPRRFESREEAETRTGWLAEIDRQLSCYVLKRDGVIIARWVNGLLVMRAPDDEVAALPRQQRRRSWLSRFSTWLFPPLPGEDYAERED